uniref:hypothetical protein n=1 Tax=Escherichia coli TaxID=562 RepID=UPI00201A8FC1
QKNTTKQKKKKKKTKKKKTKTILLQILRFALFVQQSSLLAGVFMVHQHYGTQTVNRGAVMPGMLVKHKDGTWTASANLRGRLYLHRGIERTYTRDLLVEVFLDGRGNGLNH